MSASLVGSEMCIRDSQAHSAQPGRLYRWGCCRGAARRPTIQVPPPPRPCLLYTSDAADDM
eukprot:1271739-Alexandrium_andersonii.AAC.1